MQDGYRAAEERCVIITHLENFTQGNICQQLLMFLFLISILEKEGGLVGAPLEMSIHVGNVNSQFIRVFFSLHNFN